MILFLLAGTATLITTFILRGVSLEDFLIHLPNLKLFIPTILIFISLFFFGIGLIFLIGWIDDIQ